MFVVVWLLFTAEKPPKIRLCEFGTCASLFATSIFFSLPYFGGSRKRNEGTEETTEEKRKKNPKKQMGKKGLAPFFYLSPERPAGPAGAHICAPQRRRLSGAQGPGNTTGSTGKNFGKSRKGSDSRQTGRAQTNGNVETHGRRSASVRIYSNVRRPQSLSADSETLQQTLLGSYHGGILRHPPWGPLSIVQNSQRI